MIPDISVIIMVYNRKAFLKRAIESVVNQTLAKDKYEILVILNFEDHDLDHFSQRVSFYHFSQMSVGEVIQFGIKKSNGKIICFLDDDDIFKPNKLEKVWEIFIKHTDLVYYHNNHLIFHSSFDFGRGTLFTNAMSFLPKSKQTLRSVRKALNQGGDFNMSCITIRKEAYPYNIELKFNYLQDSILFMLLLGKGDFLIDDEILTLYHLHDSSSSNQNIEIIVNSSILALHEVDMHVQSPFNRLLRSDLATNYLLSDILNVTSSRSIKKLINDTFVLLRDLTVLNFGKLFLILCLAMVSLFFPRLAKNILNSIKY
jgi:glycosyltransferase involved in cell wall biosynthesis